MQQQKNRVDHVVFIYWRENFEAALKQWSDALGIRDWDGPMEHPELGILAAQSLETGIELLAPLGNEGLFAEHLRLRGEGFFSVVFGVPKLDPAVEHAAAHGFPVRRDAAGDAILVDGMRLRNGGPAYPSWASKIKIYREALLEPVAGITVFLGEIEPVEE